MNDQAHPHLTSNMPGICCVSSPYIASIDSWIHLKQCSRRQNHLLCTSSTWSPWSPCSSTSCKGSFDPNINRSLFCTVWWEDLFLDFLVARSETSKTSFRKPWEHGTKRKHAPFCAKPAAKYCNIFVSIHPSVHSVFIPVHCCWTSSSHNKHVLIYIYIYTNIHIII